MFKNLFVLLFNIIVYPEKTWKKLIEETDVNNENFYKSYLYPVVGIIALLSFIGVLISIKQFDVQLALKTVIKDILTYFAGFYLASFCLNKWLIPYFAKEEARMILSERFTGYSSAVIYLAAMISALFPSLFFVQIAVLYSIYIIWKGTIYYLQIEESNWVKFTIFASILIIFTPFLVGTIISFIMPGMK